MQIWERTYNYKVINTLNGIPVCKQPFGYIYCIWNMTLKCPIYVGQSKYKQSHKKTYTKFKNYFGSGLLISRFLKKNGISCALANDSTNAASRSAVPSRSPWCTCAIPNHSSPSATLLLIK